MILRLATAYVTEYFSSNATSHNYLDFCGAAAYPHPLSARSKLAFTCSHDLALDSPPKLRSNRFLLPPRNVIAVTRTDRSSKTILVATASLPSAPDTLSFVRLAAGSFDTSARGTSAWLVRVAQKAKDYYVLQTNFTCKSGVALENSR